MPWLPITNHTLRAKKRPRLLIVGYGDVAKRLVTRFLAPHASLNTFTINRQPESHHHAPSHAKKSVRHIKLDLDAPTPTLARMGRVGKHIIYLAPPPSNGAANIDIRSQHLIRALAKASGQRQQQIHKQTNHQLTLSHQMIQTKRIIYMSTSGVYGDCQGALIRESQPLQPQNLRAKRRVAAERLWRQFAKSSQTINTPTGISKAYANNIHLSILRVPGIYAAQRLPIERLQHQIPALIPQDDVYTNHIHADDLAKITWLTLWRGKAQRVYHASDDTQLKMADYFDLIASHYDLPKPPRLARDKLKQLVSAIQYSFMIESRRLDNRRLKKELRIKLSYPTVNDFLKGVANAT